MYLDLYLSTDPNSPSFFGNRSIVVHAANGTRLNCANFTQMMPSEPFGTANATASATPSSTPAHNNAMHGHKVGGEQLAIASGLIAQLLIAIL
jgi:hypothetical protein